MRWMRGRWRTARQALGQAAAAVGVCLTYLGPVARVGRLKSALSRQRTDEAATAGGDVISRTERCKQGEEHNNSKDGRNDGAP